ncbi:hypothetical protein B0H17DRAFT_1049036 [Mycena rosella]|uniref:Alpha-type protein kinase domain-containing protein n=1 Tax=Mycena rosella TaxID=1033263 RepID=A0AAD7DV10_MYCRO|nr:hypothetical protein B0H17DRAFT_1049036 [Mycena rosella]
MFGESVTPLFNDRTNYEICVKQAFYTEPTQSAGVQLMQTVIHDTPFQAKLLVMEMRLLAFGTAALNGCYKWMARYIRIHGQPSFDIPQMRFVQAGLGLSEDGTKVFLIEESILLGRFLAFTQHLQYWMTLKLFFISDYQGGKGLLTDPQVLSSSELGNIFAEGNVSSGYQSFERDHVCNEFCKFFDLRTDYANWPIDSGSRLSKSSPSEPGSSKAHLNGPLFNTGGSMDMALSTTTMSG